MKSLVVLIFALPCLAEPDIFSYSPFLGRYVWSAEPVLPQIVPTTRVYQAPYTLQRGLFGAPLVQAFGASRIITPTLISAPAATTSYQAAQLLTPGATTSYQAPAATTSYQAPAATTSYQAAQLLTPGATNSYQAGQLVTPAVVATNTPNVPASHSVIPPLTPAVRNIPGLPVSHNVIEGVHGKQQLTKVGELPQRVPEMHPMRGSVYFDDNDDSKIIVRGFYYPQAGPDAFFWAGEDEPSCSKESIGGKNYLLAPGQVGSTDYFNKNQPILPTYTGQEGDMVLTLPPGASTRNLKWICVWCRKFTQNFGTLKINS